MSRSALSATCSSLRYWKQAHSTKYQLTIAKLPLAKDIDDSTYKETPINEDLVRVLAGGNFIAQQRNVVMVGGTGRTRGLSNVARQLPWRERYIEVRR